jgi:FkbM family methyltransferase
MTPLLATSSRDRLARQHARQPSRTKCSYSGCAWALAFFLYSYAIGLFVQVATPPCFCELPDNITTRIEYRDEIKCDPIRWALWGPKAEREPHRSVTARPRGETKTKEQSLSAKTNDELADENPSISQSVSKLTFYGRSIANDVYPVDRILFAKFFSGMVAENESQIILAGRPGQEKRNGVFVEVGAGGVVENSNTYFFEKELNWTGLLIEGALPNIAHLSAKKRLRPKTVMIFKAACERPGIVKMVGDGSSAGLVSDMPMDHKTLFSSNWSGSWASPYEVECDSLHSILDEHQVRNVDFMSIDVEGGELGVLRGLDFTKVAVRVIVIHLPGYVSPKESESRKILQSHDFCLAARVGGNEYWTSDAAFQKIHCGWSNFLHEP